MHGEGRVVENFQEVVGAGLVLSTFRRLLQLLSCCCFFILTYLQPSRCHLQSPLGVSHPCSTPLPPPGIVCARLCLRSIPNKGAWQTKLTVTPKTLASPCSVFLWGGRAGKKNQGPTLKSWGRYDPGWHQRPGMLLSDVHFHHPEHLSSFKTHNLCNSTLSLPCMHVDPILVGTYACICLSTSVYLQSHTDPESWFFRLCLHQMCIWMYN